MDDDKTHQTMEPASPRPSDAEEAAPASPTPDAREDGAVAVLDKPAVASASPSTRVAEEGDGGDGNPHPSARRESVSAASSPASPERVHHRERARDAERESEPNTGAPAARTAAKDERRDANAERDDALDHDGDGASTRPHDFESGAPQDGAPGAAGSQHREVARESDWDLSAQTGVAELAGSIASPRVAEFFGPAPLASPWRVTDGAWAGHIPFAFWLMEAMRPAVFVELGVHKGNSYVAFCQAVVERRLDTSCYGVDTWVGDEHAGYYGEDVYNNLKLYQDEKFSAFSRLLRTTFDDAVDYFADGSVDLLHIDGLHTYDAVRQDFETWRAKLSSSAVVLFHDINVRERDFGVRRLWDELTRDGDCPSFAFDHSNGLGVLGVGRSLAPKITEFFARMQSPRWRAETKAFFNTLGHGLLMHWQYGDLLDQNRRLADAIPDLSDRARAGDEAAAALAEARAECARLQEQHAERQAEIDALAAQRQDVVNQNQALAAAVADLSKAAAANHRARRRRRRRAALQRAQIEAMQTRHDEILEHIATLASALRDSASPGAASDTPPARDEPRADDAWIAARALEIAATNRELAAKEIQLAAAAQDWSAATAEVLRIERAVRANDLDALNDIKRLGGGPAAAARPDHAPTPPTDVTAARDALQRFLTLVHSLSARIRDLENEVAETHRMYAGSRSWRLTSPLRFATHASRRVVANARRVAAGVRALPQARARWGGFRALGGHVARRLREEGVRGVLARADAFRAQLAVSPPPEPLAATTARPAKVVGDRPLRVAYVTNHSDLMTFVYRVDNYAAVLTSEGYVVDRIVDCDAAGLALQDLDVLILCRTPWSAPIEHLVNACRDAQIPIIYDIDDLVFDPAAIELLPHVRMAPTKTAEPLRQLLEAQKRTLDSCDFVTTSTAALAAEVEKRGRPAYVVRNNNGRAQQDVFVTLRQERAKRLSAATGPVRLGYFSGTKTHNLDFLQCADALADVMDEHPQTVLVAAGEIDLPARLDRHQARIERLPLTPHMEMLENLASVDINLAPLELDNPFTDCKSELKIFEAAALGVPTVASATKTFSALINNGRNGYLARTTEDWRAALRALVASPEARAAVGEAARAEIAPAFDVENTALSLKSVLAAAAGGRLRAASQSRFTPPAGDGVVVSIVAVLYRKHNEVRYFLEALRRQTFQGDFEVILVNDASPAHDVDVVAEAERFANGHCVGGGAMRVRVIENEANLGNCGSRNRGIAEATGAIIVVVDADCMFNRAFLAEHYTAHVYPDTDVVIGPINIEAHDIPPLIALERHEADPQLAEREMIPQDPVNLESFVNCITRNFSIKRRFLEERLQEPLFDEAFAYSADPESGFGWEDVEMGCRLYAHGATIKYVDTAISIHCTHPSSTNDSDKALRSLKNFRRLFDKHPDLTTASRQWSLQTYEAIVGWATSTGADLSDHPDHQSLERRMGHYRQAPIIIDRSRPLRILTHRWHCPHQYELMKLGHDFTMVTGTGTAMTDQWDLYKRPLPRNARFERADAIDLRDYDLALVQFDENALHPELCNGKVPADWGETLKWFMANVDVPKVAICHGTPQFYGQYGVDPVGGHLLEVMEDRRREFVDFMRPVSALVCNSHQAMEEWGFANSRVIWHGFAPNEYPPQAVKDAGVLVMTMAALQNRPYYNGLTVFEAVRERLGEEVLLWTLSTPMPDPPYSDQSPEWARALYQNYAREIGRHSVYFNPTQRSPMPRSRGEAMMAGLVSVSLRNHDVDMFIKNGVNGFYADTADELAEQLLYLDRTPSQREAMGQESRRLAMDVFNQDRYLSAWSTLLKEVVS